MRALVQRVTHASVAIDGEVNGAIGRGMVIFLGVGQGDAAKDAEDLAERCAKLRIFSDASGKMNVSLLDERGEALVVSQFTLYGDTKRGNRPSFTGAAPAPEAEEMYERFCEKLSSYLGGGRVARGVFGANMKVELVNDGPVTLLLETASLA